MGVHAPALNQAVLCDFIAEGHLFWHVRRMRRTYAARRAALVDALRLLVPVDGLLLGFAAIDERAIRSGAARLARVFDRLGRWSIRLAARGVR